MIIFLISLDLPKTESSSLCKVLHICCYSISLGETLKTEGPIDRGPDKPIIGKGPIDRGSDYWKGSYRPINWKASDRPIIEKGPIDRGSYRPNVR